jgi:hypothetical protein
MDPSQPRTGGPTRRSFTPAQKLEHLAAYEAAAAGGNGGAYLRQQGLYSSQITEWRRVRDAGATNPARFSSSTPPKILHLPDSAWINPPLPAEPAA